MNIQSFCSTPNFSNALRRNIAFGNSVISRSLADLVKENPDEYYKNVSNKSLWNEDDEIEPMPKHLWDSAVSLSKKIQEDNNKIFRSKILADSKKISDKILRLPEYGDYLLPFLADKKPSELQYLYKLASSKDNNNEGRIPGTMFPYFSEIPTDRLRMLEPIILSKDANGSWNYNPKFILDLDSNYNLKQLEVMSKLAENKVNANNLIRIVNIPDVDYLDHIVEKTENINKIYGKNLKEIGFYRDDADKIYIQADVKNPFVKNKEQLEHIRTEIDYDLEPKNYQPLTKGQMGNIYSNTQTEMCVFNKKDLFEAISKVQSTIPQASPLEILTVMQRITQFANYSSLKPIADSLRKQKISYVTSSIGINPQMRYFNEQKEIFELNNSINNQRAVMFVTHADIGSEEFNKVVEKQKNNKENVLYVNLEGLGDGINLFNDDKKLADSTIDVLNKTYKQLESNSNITFSDALGKVLNDDIEAYLKSMNLNYKTINIKAPPMPGIIMKQMQPIMPNYGVMESTIDAITKHFTKSKKNSVELSNKALEYYNSNLDVYSKQRIIEDLKKIDIKINKYLDMKNLSKDNLYYLIPDSEEGCKSFGIINKMYQEIFNIPDKKFVTISSLNKLKMYPKNSTFVILDDIIGSGASMLEFADYMYCAKTIDKDKHIIFSSVAANKKGVEYIEDFINVVKRDDKVITLEDNTKDYSGNHKYFAQENATNITAVQNAFGDAGHGDDGLCTVFPYMSPDNNSTIASYLAKHFLPNSNCIKEQSEDLPKVESLAYYLDVFGCEKKKLNNSL